MRKDNEDINKTILFPNSSLRLDKLLLSQHKIRLDAKMISVFRKKNCRKKVELGFRLFQEKPPQLQRKSDRA